ncbi:hypothetical protein H671_2g7321 [Cricetulus griseus]|nr:hypothetical protein H671_2g7321 [Cricetulus griseus]
MSPILSRIQGPIPKALALAISSSALIHLNPTLINLGVAFKDNGTVKCEGFTLLISAKWLATLTGRQWLQHTSGHRAELFQLLPISACSMKPSPLCRNATSIAA